MRNVKIIFLAGLSFLLLNLICLFSINTAFAEDVQKPIVSGFFYPKDKTTLTKTVDEYIEEAKPESIQGDILAIIVPHAGYQYSGWVAGYGFKLIKNMPFSTVIVVAPSHHYSFEGLSVLNRESYLTPLGKIPIDIGMTKEFLAFDKRINYVPQAFFKEHAAEVEIPFIQRSLEGSRIVVILTGNTSYETCVLLRDALINVLKDKEDVLIVASSDMSHFHNEKEAHSIDKKTLSIIENFDPESLFMKLSNRESELCGAGGVVGVMMACRDLGADKIKVLKYATSADASKDKRQVVGYSTSVIYKTSDSTEQVNPAVDSDAKKENINMDELLNTDQKRRLLKIARQALENYIRDRKTLEPKEDDPVLAEEMGAFVTLHKNEDLRGCIGNMIGKGPLYLTIRDMAISAAMQDPRFSPVKEDELAKIDIEISVLSPLEKIDDPHSIIMGKHGVLVKSGFRSGVYLPQVATETGWSRDEFMESLCLHKAGMPADSWKKGACDIYIFTAEVFGEKELIE